jgi:hypothetical protein
MRSAALFLFVGCLCLSISSAQEPGPGVDYYTLPGYGNPEITSDADWKSFHKAQYLSDAAAPKLTIRHLAAVSRAGEESFVPIGWIHPGVVFEDTSGGLWLKTTDPAPIDPDAYPNFTYTPKDQPKTPAGVMAAVNLATGKHYHFNPDELVRPVLSCRITVQVYERESAP